MATPINTMPNVNDIAAIAAPVAAHQAHTAPQARVHLWYGGEHLRRAQTSCTIVAATNIQVLKPRYGEDITAGQE